MRHAATMTWRLFIYRAICIAARRLHAAGHPGISGPGFPTRIAAPSRLVAHSPTGKSGCFDSVGGSRQGAAIAGLPWVCGSPWVWVGGGHMGIEIPSPRQWLIDGVPMHTLVFQRRDSRPGAPDLPIPGGSSANFMIISIRQCR